MGYNVWVYGASPADSPLKSTLRIIASVSYDDVRLGTLEEQGLLMLAYQTDSGDIIGLYCAVSCQLLLVQLWQTSTHTKRGSFGECPCLLWACLIKYCISIERIELWGVKEVKNIILIYI